ncbi:MAG: Chromosome partition protein Smc [Xylophilus sp.]|nr:MAG: Chromosome partition protein Smc [Xylophilus sp.]
MVASKLAQQLKLERDKSSGQLIELGKQHHELKRFASLENDIAQLNETLAERAKQVAETMSERDTAAEKAEIVEAEVERLQKHLSSFEELADTLRIEMSAKETEHGRLMNEMSEMRRERKDASARYNEVSTQLTTAQTELKSEKRRNTELQAKLDKLITDFSDAQEKLERFTRKGSATNAETEQPAEFSKENAALREEMAALAARMVAATAEKEGENSPIHSLLDAEGSVDKGKNASPKSLASRIRDLR